MTENLFKLFKAYDLRGDAKYLSKEVYYLIGQAFVEEILKKENLPLQAVIAHDGRLTSPDFYKALCNGIMDAGCKIIPIGLCGTELMYSGAIKYDCSGLIVTASHNPGKDNGLKIVKKIPQMLGLKSGLSIIRDYVIKQIESGFELPSLKDIDEDSEKKQGSINNWLEVYKQIGDLESVNKSGKKYKIVVDTANGMGGYLMGFLKDLYSNIEFIPMYWEVDGSFPNHDADPMVTENLSDLKKSVLELKADLGVAFDGDGDRAFFIDEKGELINNEFCCNLFSKYMSNYWDENPSLGFDKSIVYVVSYTSSTPRTIISCGSAAVPSLQGHTFVKAKMKAYNAIYGAEASGHHYYGQFGFMDAGGITMGLMINILNNSNKKASQLTDYWKSNYFLSGELNRKLPQGLDIQEIRKRIKENFSDAIFWEVDGITVYYPYWKVSIRTSNTEPIARINIETEGLDTVNEKKDKIFNILGIKD